MIVPRVRRELRAWERLARTIPDPELRAHALTTLAEKATNAEAAAVFAILAPRTRLAEAVALMATFQVLTDYLDTISEQPAADPLRNGLQLHEALSDALRYESPRRDYYRHHPQRDDGGYVEQMVACCRQRFHAMPSADVVLATARRAALRCAEGQSHTHDALHRGSAPLRAWAGGLESAMTYRWWEIAAAASSSVAVHASFALATRERASRLEAERVDATYFPSVGALTVLLDNLVDRDRDAAVGGHNYLDYYASSAEATRRLSDIVDEAIVRGPGLERSSSHRAIIAGVVAFYLSMDEARETHADPIRAAVIARAGRSVRPIIALMRLKRRLARR
jgi:tetraprenyl-beta-curcumene synthase